MQSGYESLRTEIRKNAPSLAPSSAFYLKTLRADAYHYFFNFVLELLDTRIRFEKRKTIKKTYVVRGDGVYQRDNSDQNNYPLKNGYLELIKLMLEKIFENRKEFIDPRHSTALHYAVMNNHHEIAALLIEYGFDVNAPNATGETPFDFARQFADLSMLRLLVDSGVKLKAKL